MITNETWCHLIDAQAHLLLVHRGKAHLVRNNESPIETLRRITDGAWNELCAMLDGLHRFYRVAISGTERGSR